MKTSDNYIHKFSVALHGFAFYATKILSTRIEAWHVLITVDMLCFQSVAWWPGGQWPPSAGLNTGGGGGGGAGGRRGIQKYPIATITKN